MDVHIKNAMIFDGTGAMPRPGEVIVRGPRDVSLFILNHMRLYLTRIHQSHGLFVSVVIDEALAQADHQIDRITTVPHEMDRSWEGPSPSLYADDLDDDLTIEEEDEDDEGILDEAADDDQDGDALETTTRETERPARTAAPAQEDDATRRKGRRRRRGRRGEEPRAPAERAPVAPPAPDLDAEGGDR